MQKFFLKAKQKEAELRKPLFALFQSKYVFMAIKQCYLYPKLWKKTDSLLKILLFKVEESEILEKAEE